MKKWILFVAMVAAAGASKAIVIDHTCTDLSQIPSYWIQAAKSNLLVGYGHTSHGSQIVSGLNVLLGDEGTLYYFTQSGWGLETNIFLNDYWGNAGGADDLGHNGYLGWQEATSNMLALAENDRNVVMWSWCGGVSDNDSTGIMAYLNAMSALESTYPAIQFIYMTGHLDGSGVEGNLNQMNNLIRNYCRANDKILFDFADIESYDPDGAYYLDRAADDGCNYEGGNWADEYCAAHPGSALCDYCDCAHSMPLNCNRKARAFWWLMARLAGWPGGPVAGTASVATGRVSIAWSSLCTGTVYEVRRSTNLLRGAGWGVVGRFTNYGTRSSWTEPTNGPGNTLYYRLQRP